MELSDWVGQKAPFLNATSFAAVCLTSNPDLSGMSFYIKDCMEEALGGPYETPEPRYRAALYVPAAVAWMSIAGPRIYQLCKEELMGFDLGNWESWKVGFGKVEADHGVDGEIREAASRAKGKMEHISMLVGL
jgi:hypothetical protein